MQFWRIIKRFIRAAIAPACLLSLVAYFAWNVAHGDRGLMAYMQRQQLLASAQGDLTRALAEQRVAERRVSGLRAAHIDRDALDQQARANLNLSEPTDIIVPFQGARKLY